MIPPIAPPPVPVELHQAAAAGLLTRLLDAIWACLWWGAFWGSMFGVGLAAALVLAGYSIGRTR